MKKSWMLLSLATLLLGLVSCEPAVESTIALNTNSLSLLVGEKATLVATITPERPSETLVWESSNKMIAAVDENGVVTAKNEGEAIISVSTKVGRAECLVSVTRGALKMNMETADCLMYDCIQLSAEKPEHKKDAKEVWMTGNKEIAVVNSKGLVTGVAPGTTTIKATLTGCVAAVCTVTVKEVPVSFARKYLIEHFTGEDCGYCPGGMYAIVEYLESATTPSIWVSHHYGFGSDEYTISESSNIGNTLGVNGAPNMSLNRSKQSEGLTFHPGYLPEITIADKTEAAMSVEINRNYNATTRQLDVTVSGECTYDSQSKFLVSVLIKENRLVGQQADYTYSWKTAKWKEYMHARVIRDMLTLPLGDTIELVNRAYSKTWSYTVPEKWVAENCCVVAYVTPLVGQPIINAEQVVLVEGTTGGEEYLPYGITEGKGPNKEITFKEVKVSRIEEENLLEVLLVSDSKISTEYGDAQAISAVYIHTDAETLTAGTYPIKADGSAGSIQAGYRIDEKKSFGGSLLLYAVSENLANGQLAPAHIWRMNEGEMVVDEAGNITFNFKTYNGTSVTSSYQATSASQMPQVRKPAALKHYIDLNKTNK
jgi:hypothetical protein